jgi:hypothetical protein
VKARFAEMIAVPDKLIETPEPGTGTHSPWTFSTIS